MADRSSVAADPFFAADSAASRLASLTGVSRHDVAVVLGSGWGPAAAAMGQVEAEVAVTELGGFPAPSAVGHGSTVRSVRQGDRRILVFLGRVHLYEGHDPATVVHGVRTAVAAGCRTIVLTNAAGGVSPDYAVGQPVLVADHINLTGRSPLTGPVAPPPHDVRFVDMTEAYSARLRAVAKEVDPGLAEGVYAGLPGPQFETPAEVRMARTLGADLVGMSTVLETIAAVHLGAEVLACALVTNVAAGMGSEKLSHEEVLEAGQRSAGRIGELIAAVTGRL